MTKALILPTWRERPIESVGKSGPGSIGQVLLQKGSKHLRIQSVNATL